MNGFVCVCVCACVCVYVWEEGGEEQVEGDAIAVL